jgi:hypothetical protein
MRPWQRQTHESPSGFTAFVAYLRLKGRRSHRAVAAATGHSVHAIRRLSARFNWPARVAAFEARLAAATEDALTAVIANSAGTERSRVEQLRRDQSQLAQDVAQAAQRWLAACSRPNQRLPSLTQLVRLVDLASQLGRRAAGMPTGDVKRPPRKEDASGYWTQPSVEEALEKIYGANSPYARENQSDTPSPSGDPQSATSNLQPATSNLSYPSP